MHEKVKTLVLSANGLGLVIGDLDDFEINDIASQDQDQGYCGLVNQIDTRAKVEDSVTKE